MNISKNLNTRLKRQKNEGVWGYVFAQRRNPCTVPQRSVFRALLPASGSPRLSNHRDAPVYTRTPLQTTALLGAPHPTAPPNTSTPSAPLGHSWSLHQPATLFTLFLSPTHSLHRHYSP